MTGPAPSRGALVRRLRRDLGTVESYAALLGILIGAGIFRVTSEAWALSGPSVILGYLFLAPAVLSTSVAYAVFLSTPLGREPGGEYLHLSRTFGSPGLAFVGAWLKIISYVGALAFLTIAFADYVIPLFPGRLSAGAHRMPLALGGLVFFYLVHAFGVRWFGRLQVAMCALLGLSIIVLVVPGLFALRPGNYRPFFTHGAGGFAACLPPLFFAYAGFESLAQTAGEVKDSTARLPRIFVKGILLTTAVFLLMSVVTFGVLPGADLRLSTAPMAEVAAVYLPAGGAAFVTLGAVMALATSLNATMMVPSRLGIILAEDHLIPRCLGAVDARTGTPVIGLTLTLGAAVLLLVSGQVSLALNIAVFALVILYFLHSLALLFLPRFNPGLFGQVRLSLARGWQVAAAILSLAFMGGLIAVQVVKDLQVLQEFSLRERIAAQSITSLELVVMWSGVGLVLYGMGRRTRRRTGGR
ncbi:MAG: APC family permease [Acidobacteriota bacterium]